MELSLENIQVENTKGSNDNMFNPIFSDEVQGRNILGDRKIQKQTYLVSEDLNL